MDFRKRNYIIFCIFFLPPFLFSLLHIKEISISEDRKISKENFTVMGTSSELPRKNPQEISPEEYLAQINTDKNVEKTLDNIMRYSSVFDIQPNLIRYNVFLQNTLTTKISYSTEQEPKTTNEKYFSFDIICRGEKINVLSGKYLIASGIRLNDDENNNRVLLDEIRKDCFFFPYGGIKNDSGQILLVYTPQNELKPEGKITIIIRPDVLSKIIIIIGWYIFWFGFLTLIIEGPIKYLRKK